jgi:hypothetical protein
VELVIVEIPLDRLYAPAIVAFETVPPAEILPANKGTSNAIVADILDDVVVLPEILQLSDPEAEAVDTPTTKPAIAKFPVRLPLVPELEARLPAALKLPSMFAFGKFDTADTVLVTAIEVFTVPLTLDADEDCPIAFTDFIVCPVRFEVANTEPIRFS